MSKKGAAEDDDPRALRKQVEALSDRIQGAAADLVAKPETIGHRLEDATGITKALMSHTDAVAAAGVAGILRDLAEYNNTATKALKGSGGLPNIEEFSNCLEKMYGAGRGALDFRALGADVAGIMFDAPIFRPFMGSMTVALKTAKAKAAAEKKAPRVKDNVELERPEENVEDAPAEALNANRSSEILGQIQDLLKSDVGRKVMCDDSVMREVVPFVSVLFDPYSFSQTVENLFYFSFLVKAGAVGVHKGRDDPSIYICISDAMREGDGNEGTADGAPAADTPEREATAGAGGRGGRKRAVTMAAPAGPTFAARQFVLQLDPDSWKRICGIHSLKKPLLHHRKSQDSAAPAGFRFYEEPERLTGGATHAAGSAGTKRRHTVAAEAAAAASSSTSSKRARD